MANLTETQIYFRRSILFMFAMTMVFYTLKFGVNQVINVYRFLFPIEIPPPESKYGKLPELKMTTIKYVGGPEYILDTSNGGLPNFPERMRVYKIPVPESNLLSEQRVKGLATDFKFDDNFTKKNASEYKWIDGINNRTYDADVVTGAFQLNSGTDKLSTVVNGSLTITTTDSISQVESFIVSKGLVQTTDLSSLRYETIPSIVTLGRLRESKIDRDRSKLMKVDVYRDFIYQKAVKDKTHDLPEIKYKILGPNPKNSLINFYITNAAEPFKFPIINFTYSSVDYNDSSEYYVSSIGNIWSAVIQGKGVVTYLKTDNDDYYESFKQNMTIQRINIKDIYVAYYETREYQPYLQPIYVFEGTFSAAPASSTSLAEKGKIFIYYPAVRGDYVGSN